MPYCPQCIAEYVEGTVECEDCRVSLQPGAPPEDRPRPDQAATLGESKLVRLRSFSGGSAQLDADLARNILRTQGIPCVLPGEFSAALLPVLEVPLLVREEDRERAAEVLKIYLDSPGPIPGE